MRRAVGYALEPLSDVEKVLGFLDGFRVWMAKTADSWLDRHDPSRELALSLDKFPEEVRFAAG